MPSSRRTLLSGALAAAAAGAALPGTASAGSHGRGRRVPREAISIQLYTLRGIIGDDPEPVLSALADIGYRRVELAGTYGRSAAEFAKLLRRHRLRASSAHVGIDGDLDQVIADARTLGNQYVVVPYVNYATLAEWRAFAERLEEAGRKLRRAGLSLGYHNHAHEFAPVEGRRPFDVITSTTTRRNVHLEVDLYWAVVGGVDPVEVWRRDFPRVRQFHVKDRAPDGSFADLGKGNIDFARIFRATDVAEYIVENDEPKDALVTAQVGYDYLTKLRY
ncbi:sugar phosphate isomerase/epimerase [Saccharothrix coeruleofusca]|uniref:sugar phosphate isomerase/epimerase family protein n=1 Tax=Saccharothrix coeruleofusca TaxID=33919 RepID=UPI001AE4D18C|nr:sugar phosphate isomerase/epimerase [Saccharothrix coeruleofusca]MBP2335093.1 sugar phosphate isomerase/epimerase [Saccharothrix coeruleofusca]